MLARPGKGGTVARLGRNGFYFYINLRVSPWFSFIKFKYKSVLIKIDGDIDVSA
jgi:hypothetical protein